MYKVIPSPINHVSVIADLLSQHFNQQNSLLGTALYSSDINLMERVVSERISDQDSPYSYISISSQAGACLGFVGTYRRGATGEIQILLLIGETDLEEKTNNLLEAAHKQLKSKGVATICTEVSINEKVLRKILQARKARVVSENLVFAT